ncbi:hypothetical protein ABFT23_06810 [Nocardioides sp. C4-1]|uniref:hypothetical protein n=1 Tax=Nocardioides sp. C4-1 TaxID=3151851 RepID=UPI003267BB57
MNDDLRAARRRAARLHHPDLGGDADAFVAALRELDDRYAGEGPARDTRAVGAPVVEVVTTWRGRRRRAVRVVRDRARPLTDLVGRLPSSWPGSHRYGRL